MKTFSSMATPDKRLTLQAYEQLGVFFMTLSEKAGGLPPEVKDKIRIQTHRLLQLIEALELEILSE